MLAVAYAASALLSGLDRQGEEHSTWAAYVPQALAVRSLKSRGQDLLEARRGAELVTLGRSYVSRAPYDGVASGLLGAGYVLTGRQAEADQAFRAAAQYGWRISLIQSYWLERSLIMGDGAVAAMRLDALLRRDPGLTSSATVLSRFETDPELQTYLVAHMGQMPDWTSYFASDISSNVSDERIGKRASILNRLAASGHPIGCEMARPITYRLVLQGQGAMALTYWRAQCPGAGRGLLADGDLRDVALDDRDASAFRWQVLTNGDVSAELTQEGGAGRLQLRNSSDFAMPFIRQMIVAPVGDYDVTWFTHGAFAAGQPLVAPTFSCRGDGAVPAQPVTALGQDRWTSRVHVDADCQGHWLSFQIAASSQAATFGQVEMRPIATHRRVLNEGLSNRGLIIGRKHVS